MHSYDKNGSLTNDGTTAYTFDVQNRLRSAAGAHNATLDYDPMGRLASLTSGGTTTRFLYDGDDLVAEYSGTGTLLRRYVHGSGADEPLVQYEGANLADRRYLHADHHGSIVAVTSAFGTSYTNRYDEYGVPQSGNLGRFQYTGQLWLGELGVYHYKARSYSPRLGRFLQVDPIGYEDSYNIYSYSHSDPINSVDPSGNDSITCSVIDGELSQCTFVADDRDTTSVTYNETQHYTDAYGVEQSTTQSFTINYQGSIFKEGALSRFILGTGDGILAGVSDTLSQMTHRQVSVGRPDSTPSMAGYTPVAPAASPIWRGLRNHRNGIRTDGNRYYKYDRRHGEIEVYNRQGAHLGTQNAQTGAWEKGPVPGRNIKEEL